MSFKRQNLVLSHSKTKGPQRLLLMILAHHVNNDPAKDDGVCWPGYKLLSQEMGCEGDSTATVKRVIGQLKETGEVLVSDGRGRKYGHYLITLGMSEAEVRTIVDDYEKKGIKFDTFQWEKTLPKVSEPEPFDDQKGIESDTYNEGKVSILNTKGINSDTPMLTKKNSKKKELKGELEPLAVHTYRKVARLYPDKALWQTLDEIIGDKAEDLEFWEQVVTDWIGCGWRKTNLKGMIEHFERRELPTTGGEANGHNKSGSRKSKANGQAGGEAGSTSLTDAYLENNAKNIDRKLDSLYRG